MFANKKQSSQAVSLSVPVVGASALIPRVFLMTASSIGTLGANETKKVLRIIALITIKTDFGETYENTKT